MRMNFPEGSRPPDLSKGTRLSVRQASIYGLLQIYRSEVHAFLSPTPALGPAAQDMVLS